MTPVLAGCRILLVDDDDDSLEAMTMILRLAGAVVTDCHSAAEALSSLEEGDSPPTVILADVCIPGFDGYALLDAVRKLPEGKGARAPALALTGGLFDDARGVEFVAYLQKPLLPDVLIDAMSAACGLRAPRAEP